MIEHMIDMAYNALEGSEDLMKYHDKHGTPSFLILTQFSPQIAIQTARLLLPDIKDKRVIEIGAGVGFLAIEMAKIAKSVIAIEVDPAWSWIFTHSLYRHKPPNLTWIFGDAGQMTDYIKGDIVVIMTRSGIKKMTEIGYKMAPKVILPLQYSGGT